MQVEIDLFNEDEDEKPMGITNAAMGDDDDDDEKPMAIKDKHNHKVQSVSVVTAGANTKSMAGWSL